MAVIVERLKIDGLRNLKGLDLSLGSGLHVFVGPNGIGKTSILEAAALLGSGRSFRSGGKEALIGRDATELTVFAELQVFGSQQRIGFERNARTWRARVNGEDVKSLVELVRLAPIWVIEPASHELISGGSESRRSLFDWLMFHVEPSYAALAARYKSAVRQRNALLKVESTAKELDPWTAQVVMLGTEVAELRASYSNYWETSVSTAAARLLPELGLPSVQFKSGWPAELEPSVAMQQRLARDRALGHTSAGPHRADWSLQFERVPSREQYSRGQAKNACFAAVFGTLALYTQLTGEKPLLCLDDLFSELDQDHQAHCLKLAFELSDQVFVTGVEASAALQRWPGSSQVWAMETLVAR